MYIYKLGTECDGAQMRASDVYIPTLVALLGLCFDPSECFWDLRIWSGVVGNKSGKLRYVSRIVTEWPSQSPDLNPIEHLWNHVKKKLGEYEEPPSGVHELWDQFQEEWEKIEPSVCQNLIESMPRRIEAVLKARGGYTKY